MYCETPPKKSTHSKPFAFNSRRQSGCRRHSPRSRMIQMQPVLSILKSTSLQFIAAFGVLFIAAMTLTWISRWTNNLFQQFRFPRLGLYLFGIIGIPAHELSHALFAKLFFHRIHKVKWFDPQAKGGSYGVVIHSYSLGNWFQRLGLFFIGLGPTLLAPLLLMALFALLIPQNSFFHWPSGSRTSLGENLSQLLFSPSLWTSARFYLFLYLGICLTSQMELSEEDFKVARGGLLPIFAILLVANAIAYFFKWNLNQTLGVFWLPALHWWLSFLALALGISLFNLLACYLVFSPLNLLFGKKAINPFRSGRS